MTVWAVSRCFGSIADVAFGDEVFYVLCPSRSVELLLDPGERLRKAEVSCGKCSVMVSDGFCPEFRRYPNFIFDVIQSISVPSSFLRHLLWVISFLQFVEQAVGWVHVEGGS